MTIWKAFIATWSSRKLWAFVFTVCLLWVGLERAVVWIDALPAEKLSALTYIAGIVFGGMVCAAGAYMGFSAKFDASSVSRMLQEGVHETVNRTENVNVRVPKAAHFDDGGSDLD